MSNPNRTFNRKARLTAVKAARRTYAQALDLWRKQETPTYWNAEPAFCKRVKVVVGKAPPTWWCASLEGTTRDAVRVAALVPDKSFSTLYLDADDGKAWKKVTTGMGAFGFGHKDLPVLREVEL